MGLASYYFTKNIDRTWRLLENLEAGMIGMNTGNSSAAESPFGGIKVHISLLFDESYTPLTCFRNPVMERSPEKMLQLLNI
jgi:hypothetical protein